jgi:general secretion pathway protein A
MVLDYYNLREHPFGVTPDSKYLFLSPTHREALASVTYGIEAGSSH